MAMAREGNSEDGEKWMDWLIWTCGWTGWEW